MNTNDDRLAAAIAPHARAPGGSILRTRSGDRQVLHHWDGARLLVLTPPGESLPAGETASLLMELDEGATTIFEVRGTLLRQEPRQWRLAWLLAQIRRHGVGRMGSLPDRCGPSGDIVELEAHHAAMTVVDTS